MQREIETLCAGREWSVHVRKALARMLRLMHRRGEVLQARVTLARLAWLRAKPMRRREDGRLT